MKRLITLMCWIVALMAVYDVPLQPLAIADNWRMVGALAVVIMAVLNYRFLFMEV